MSCSFSSSSPRYHMQAPFSRTAFELLSEQAARSPDRPIAITTSGQISYAEIFFAATALGTVVVPFSTWSTSAELDFLLQDSGVLRLFTLARLGERDFAADIAALRARGGLAARARRGS